jgi:hypothetical protein
VANAPIGADARRFSPFQALLRLSAWAGALQCLEPGDSETNVPEPSEDLPPSGPLQVRPVGAVEPLRMRPQARVDRFLSSP